ncbi:MAG: hypothetical protein AAB434_02280 [Planctomycetota bacterium]
MDTKKTDPYAAFLLAAGVLLVVGMVFTWRQYKAMQAAETRLARTKEWWDKSLLLEKDIRAFPQKGGAAGTVWTTQDVNDAIFGGNNEKVKALVQEPLKDKYHLDLNSGGTRAGSVQDIWSYEAQTLKVNRARLEDLGMFVSVVEYLFPQAKTTLINYARSPEKPDGNGTVELTIYTEKEK